MPCGRLPKLPLLSPHDRRVRDHSTSVPAGHTSCKFGVISGALSPLQGWTAVVLETFSLTVELISRAFARIHFSLDSDPAITQQVDENLTLEMTPRPFTSAS